MPDPGAIEEIPDAVSARQVRPQNPGRPSDTRVLLVEVACGHAHDGGDPDAAAELLRA